MNLIVFSLIITALGNKILASNLGGDDDEVVVGGFSPVQPENKSEVVISPYNSTTMLLFSFFSRTSKRTASWTTTNGTRLMDHVSNSFRAWSIMYGLILNAVRRDAQTWGLPRIVHHSGARRYGQERSNKQMRSESTIMIYTHFQSTSKVLRPTSCSLTASSEACWKTKCWSGFGMQRIADQTDRIVSTPRNAQIIVR